LLAVGAFVAEVTDQAEVADPILGGSVRVEKTGEVVTAFSLNRSEHGAIGHILPH